MNAPILEFIATGDEVMRGLIADTNTQITAARLYPLGVRLRRTTVVGDRGEDIRRALLETSVRADFCIVSGGLGPTADDLTAACAAQAAGVPMRTYEPWLDHLRKRWARIRPNEIIPSNNLRQADVPETAEVLGNPDGSAPAFAMRIDRCLFFFLPGVPREYHRIVEEMVLPRVVAATGNAVLRWRILQCFGVTESKLDELVSGVREAHPEVRFGFRTRFPENHLSLAALAQDVSTAEANLAVVERLCRQALGDFVYGQDGATFAQAVGEELARRGETIACAESCTGGLLTQMLTEVPGSSNWAVGAYVTYSNAMKQSALGVPAELLKQHGAVSEPVVRAMAEGARQRSGATWAAAITGVAGPDGGTPDKPVGTVWLGLCGPQGATTRLAHFRGDRGQVRTQSAYGALQLLREALGHARPA
ncbi:MAG TPA: CinA family nicotinamide mononucleotide deamidase-related protein [Myxococcales bacterium]|nr:CinA family nicotinamide mononucleotide deamidase-related protein [Myxococcales bacterium]